MHNNVVYALTLSYQCIIINTSPHTHIHIRIHKHIQTHTHTHTHTYTHTHPHTYYTEARCRLTHNCRKAGSGPKLSSI